VPTILQMEAVECGAAALAMILAGYKRWVSLEELRQACDVTINGANAASLLQIGREYGLEARGYRVGIDALARHTMPVIIYWGLNHFVVLEGYRHGKWYINDPSIGRRTVDEIEFGKFFTGVVLEYAPGPEFKPGGHKPSVIRGLAARFKGSGRALQFCVLAGVLLIIPGVLVPTFAKIFVDDILILHFDNWIEPLLIAMAATTILRAILTWLECQYLLRMETRLALDTGSYFLWHLLHLPLPYFGQRMAGDLVQRVHSNDTVASILSNQLASTVISFITVSAYLIVLLSYDVTLTLIAFGTASVSLVAVWFSNRARADEAKRLQQETGRQMGVLMAGFAAIDSVKAGGRERDFFNRWAGHQAITVRFWQRLGLFSLWLQSVPNLLQHLVTHAVVLGFGGWQIIQGTLSVGDLAAIQALVAAFLGPFGQIVSMGQQLQTVQADLSRLDDVLACPREDGERDLDPPSPDELKAAPADALDQFVGKVTFDAVSYGYSNAGAPTVHDLNLTLDPGSFVAIVGAAGAESSTLAQLIVGLLHPQHGRILIDDHPIDELDNAALARAFGFLEDNSMLFEGTIIENITLFSPWLRYDDVIHAAKDAGIHDEIVSRPGGYEAAVHEGGTNFSGGQRQRIQLAQVLAKAPPILVLDGATSALDADAEADILTHLRERGYTTILLTKRISVAKQVDRVLVLEHGQIVQDGTHDELVKNDGPYLKLVQQQ
jgi:NHLM bacteriocin system ABC transporter peptidase/ATP-binding protein